jgi:hypothetical protein
LFHRVVRILVAVVGCIVLLFLLLVGLLVWYMHPPSDLSLERRFYEHRADLEQIVNMMEQDVHMQRIASDFTRNSDWDSETLKPRQISDQRWDQYREMFRRVDVPMGIQRGVYPDDIEIMVWAAGLSIAGDSLSYLHCGKPAKILDRYLPCIERKDSGKFENGDVFIRYKRIEGDWYLFEFSN